MTTCIYYEQEAVSADDARQARSMAGCGAREATPSDTDWGQDIDGPPPQREPNFRSQQVLQEWMPRVSGWGECLEATAPGAALAHGMSLAEVAKFELLFDLAAAAQRWQALAEIRRRWNPDRLLWFSDRRDGELLALCRAVAPFPIEVHRGGKRNARPWKSAWDAFKNAVGPRLDRAREIAAAAVRTPRWPSERPDIVCTEYFPNSVAGSVMVAEKLQSQYGLRICWIAGRKKVAEVLADRGIESLLLTDLMSTRAHRRAGLSADQRRAVRSALRALPDELFGGQARSGAREYLLTVLEPRVLKAWNNAAYWIEAYHEVFSVIRPKAVLSTTYSSPIGRASALAAQRFGGRAIYLQHGLFPRCSAYCSFCHDLLLMWGPNELRILSDFGVDPRTVRVTGPAIYDQLARRRSGVRVASVPPLGEPLKVAFMASRTGGLMVSRAQSKMCLLAVATAVVRSGQAHLTVKVHPGDQTGMIQEVMRDFPQFAVVQSGSAHKVIVEADVVIVVSSTTGLEACVADKPLIVLDVFDDPNTVPYVGYGAAVSVPLSNAGLAADLEQVLSNLRQDSKLAGSLAEGRQRLLDDMLNGAAGDAVDLAASAVAEALGRCEAQALVQGSRQGDMGPLSP